MKSPNFQHFGLYFVFVFVHSKLMKMKISQKTEKKRNIQVFLNSLQFYVGEET